MPSAEDAVYLNYVVQGFGVFLGVIAGTAVTLLVQYLIQYKDIQQQTKNLKFELELNVGKIDAWLDELGKYRNAVNGDALHNYFGYFDLSRTVSNTTSTMFISGRLYKKLTHDQIGQLQAVFSTLSFNGERYMNEQVTTRIRMFNACRAENRMDYWTTTGKSEVVRDINFWEQKLTAHREEMKNINQGLT